MPMTFEQLQWGAEACALLPFIYAMKIWQAHNEFIEQLCEDLSNVIP